MDEMKNIAFAKIGKSIKFKTNKYSPIGGDNEASCVLRALANNNPDKNFYVVGRSDFSTLSENEIIDLFPYGNVIDVWEGVGLNISPEYYRHIINYFDANSIEIDFCVMMVGQVGSVTIPDKIKKVRDIDDEKPASVLNMTKWYVTPISTWLNEVKPRYIEIVNDPRYTMRQSIDLFHLPEVSLGQYDYTYTTFAIKSYEDQARIERKVQSVYAGMETAFCGDYEYFKDFNTERNTNVMIVLNEGKPSRYDMLNEWILQHFDDVDIYGKWEDDRAKKDSRFKGSKNINEIQKMLSNVKYTFIIPIAKGWVTSKYIEMIHAGVIPFFHPTYDEQGHTGVPNFFRPKTPEELRKKIELLNADENLYKESITKLRNIVLKPSYYDGTFISQKILSAIDSNYTLPDTLKYEKKEKSRGLEDFFS
jgi:hypothetical protein